MKGVEEEQEHDGIHSSTVKDKNMMRPADITSSEMGRIGFKVKRILDQCRVTYLRTLGLHAYQVRSTRRLYLQLTNDNSF